MGVRTVQGSAISPRTISTRPTTSAVPTPWVRNPDWLNMPTVLATDQKFVGLIAVQADSSFIALSASGAYTVNWGDGTAAENIAAGVQANHLYAYGAAGLTGTDKPVTFTATTKLVNRTAHGKNNGDVVRFFKVLTTVGVAEGLDYYVINATANTFQVSATLGGASVTMTGNGSAAMLPYKQALVTVTPQAGQNLTALDLSKKHTFASLPSGFETGWLDLIVSGPNFTTSGLVIAGVSASPPVKLEMVERASIINSGSATDFSYNFTGMTSLRTVDFPDTLAVTLATGMFYGCASLQTTPLFNTALAANMSSMFLGCAMLQDIPLLDTSRATVMSSMFSGCVSLRGTPLFNTAAVTSMSSMFSGCASLQSVPLFNTAAVTSMSSMFQASGLQFVPLFNTAAVTTTVQMFYSCFRLQSVPLFNTAAVTNMSSMFRLCPSLQSVPLFNTSSVTNMADMFFSTSRLQSVPLFNTAAVTNMSGMFQASTSLQSVPLFNTAAVTNISGMFIGCPILQSVPLFNTAAVTNMSSMFLGCSSLQSVPLFNTAAVTNMSSMFSGCYLLTRVPAIILSAVPTSSALSSTFLGCYSLYEVAATGIKYTFSVAGCKLSAAALNALYTSLPTVTGQTITVTGNHGTATDTPTIATNKGWTVTG